MHNNNIQVIAPARGRNFHLDADCAGLWQGWTNSGAFAPQNVSIDAAEMMGLYACRRCYRRHGAVIPFALDSVRQREIKRQVRIAQKALRTKASTSI